MEEVKVLINKKEIDKKVEELAAKLDKEYEGKEITVLSVLNGAAFFTVELTLKMKTKKTMNVLNFLV